MGSNSRLAAADKKARHGPALSCVMKGRMVVLLCSGALPLYICTVIYSHICSYICSYMYSYTGVLRSRTDIQLYRCSVQMYICTVVKMYICTFVQFCCTVVQMYSCTGVLNRCTVAQLYRCAAQLYMVAGYNDASVTRMDTGL